MLKVVYLIASHKNPEQVYRLVKTIKNGSQGSVIIINHDFSSSFLDCNLFSKFKNVFIIKNFTQLNWGEFSIVKATLNTFEFILKNIEFEWVIFISGQDFPIQPLKQIESSLEKTFYDGFLSGVSIEKAIPCGMHECQINRSSVKRCPDCLDRYYYQYFLFPEAFYSRIFVPKIIKSCFNMLLPYLHLAQSLLRLKLTPFNGKHRLKIGIRSSFFDNKPRMPLYKGSQWFTLNRKCIEYILNYVTNNPEIVTYYQRTIIPDESFFQTILYNCQHLKINKNNKRFIVWQNSNAKNPNILKLGDFTDIISSGCHFARKFDITIDSNILDKLEKHIH